MLINCSIRNCIIILALTALPSCAASLQTTDEIAAYNKGDYNQTINIGWQVVAQYPNDATAHYYLANALMIENQQRQAEDEYSRCLKVASDPVMKNYANQALLELQRLSTSRLAYIPSTVFNPGTTTLGSSKLDEEQIELQARLEREGRAEEEFLQRRAEFEIANTNGIAQARIASIPRNIYSSRYGYDDMNYRNEVASIQLEANNKIASLRSSTDRDIARAKQYYLDKVREGLSLANNINSQVEPGTSDIQMHNRDLNMYVHNYVNYGTEPVTQPKPAMPELKAKRESI